MIAESDLVALCIEMKSHLPYELFLKGFFKVDVTTQNYEAVTDFICRYAGVFI